MWELQGGCLGGALPSGAVQRGACGGPCLADQQLCLSGERLDHRRADQRVGEVQNQRAGEDFPHREANAARLLSMGSWGVLWRTGDLAYCSVPEKLLCLPQAHCTVFCSVSSETAVTPGHFFPPRFSSSQNAVNGQGCTKIIDFVASEK